MDNDNSKPGGLGLPPGVVWLCNYSSAWRHLYNEQESQLRVAMKNQLLDIRHVGSTSVPGMRSKPIIDILLGVAPANLNQCLIEPLETLHYNFIGDQIVLGHHIFGKGSPPGYLLHVVEHNGAAWQRVTAFRDILMTDAAVACQYESLKMRLSVTLCKDRMAYANAKTSFIDSAIINARGRL
jgi:GrpB-like predicted nucleotidyltransferase (UPF0157 family)